MIIERKSGLTGVTHRREVNCTQQQIDRWKEGEFIQNAMPQLSADDREYIMTGITPEEWLAAFGSEDDAVGESTTSE